MWRLLIALTAISLAASACATGVGAPKPAAATADTMPTLEGSAWVLAALPGRQAALPAGVRPTLRFETTEGQRRVLGSDGCNRYSSGYTLRGAELSIGPRGAGTMRACVEPHQQVADDFRAALDRTRGWRIENDSTLVLLDASGQTVARLSAQPTQLAGTSWQLLSVNNGRSAVVSVLPADAAARPSVVFGSDGGITGFGGCNRFFGRFREGPGGAVEISELGASRMACRDPAQAEQEAALLAALPLARTSRREGERLELRRADGSVAALLTLAQP